MLHQPGGSLGQCLVYGIGGRLGFTHGGQVDLDFRLGAGGTHHQLMPARKAVFQHIGTGRPGAVGIVIDTAFHCIARQRGGGIGAQVLHQLLHRVHTAFALKGKAAQRVAVVTELLVQCLDGVQQRFALSGVPSRCFTDKQRGIDSVLVADVCAGQVAVAFLKAEDIAVRVPLGFQLADLFTDELKAGQGAAQLHTVFFCHRRCHIGGNDGRYCHGVGGHRALRHTGAADVIQQNDAHLIAGNQAVAALAIRHGGAAAVAVRVGAQQQIGVNFVAQLQAFLHSFADFRVRVRAGRGSHRLAFPARAQRSHGSRRAFSAVWKHIPDLCRSAECRRA